MPQYDMLWVLHCSLRGIILGLLSSTSLCDERTRLYNHVISRIPASRSLQILCLNLKWRLTPSADLSVSQTLAQRGCESLTTLPTSGDGFDADKLFPRGPQPGWRSLDVGQSLALYIFSRINLVAPKGA